MTPAGDPGVPAAAGDEPARGRYEVFGEHARGGLGRILDAEDLHLERGVAIKELLTDAPVARERFDREVRLTARLQHPGVVPVYEASCWPDGSPFYVMRMVEGRTLKELIAQTRSTDERVALVPKLLAVVETMAYAHSMGIMHRDLKPSNVIVGSFGETVVLDWGLAKELSTASTAQPDSLAFRGDDNELTYAGTVVGTPAYMAPEQARGLACDLRTDIYGLGAMAYHVFSGRMPFADRSTEELMDALRRDGAPPPLAHDVPTELRAIVSRAMKPRPEERYQSAKELAEDLVRFQAGRLVTAHRYSALERARRWLQRHRTGVTIGSLAVFLVASIAVGLIWIREERSRSQREAERAKSAAELSLAAEAEARKQRSVADKRLEEIRTRDELVTQSKDELAAANRQLRSTNAELRQALQYAEAQREVAVNSQRKAEAAERVADSERTAADTARGRAETAEKKWRKLYEAQSARLKELERLKRRFD